MSASCSTLSGAELLGLFVLRGQPGAEGCVHRPVKRPDQRAQA